MSSSRVQAPPVNLKERIAALQNRNVSPGQRPTTAPGGAGAGLRDKIAKFEQKGGIPVPRGSFGLGAPPVAEAGESRRKGELYGNRIPGPLRGTSASISRSGSPMLSDISSDTTRRLSWSGLDYDGDISPPSTSAFSPYTELSSPPQSPPQTPTSTSSSPSIHSAPAPRHTAFATALDIARRTASASDALGRYDTREASLSPPPPFSLLSTPMMLSEDQEAQNCNTPPSIVISSEDTSFATELSSDLDDDLLTEAGQECTSLPMNPPSPEEENTSSLALPVIPPPEEQAHSQIVAPLPSPSPEPSAHEKMTPSIDSLPEVDTTLHAINSAKAKIEIPTDFQNDDLNECLHDGGGGEPETLPPPEARVPVTESHLLRLESDAQSVTSSPLDEHDLALQEYLDDREDHDMAAGDVGLASDGRENYDVAVENVETRQDGEDRYAEHDDLALEGYPDEEEDYDAAAEHADLALEEHPGEEDWDVHAGDVDLALEEHPYEEEEEDVAAEDVDLALEEHPDEKDVAAGNAFVTTNTPAQPEVLVSPHEDEGSEPLSPLQENALRLTRSPSTARQSIQSTTSSRPHSMIETSPCHITVAQRVQPVTTRGVPMFIPPAQREALSPHPQSPEETEFGTVSLHRQSHSYSHPQTYVSHYAEPDLDSSSAASSSKQISFSAVVHGKVTEIPSSPSMSSLPRNLATTPQLARARRSMKAEPSTSPANGELAVLLEDAAKLEKRLLEGDLPSEARPWDSEQQLKMARSKEGSMKALPPEPQVKRNVSEGHVKPKFSFRNTLARGKSSHRREVNNLSIQTPQGGHPRSRSAFASIRPLPVQPSREGVSYEKVDHGVAASPTTPTKSPLPRYISGLRRLASASRSSSALPGAYPRLSVSTSSEISSDDSTPVVTPPDDSLDFATAGQIASSTPRNVSESGSESGAMWPSVSPKKLGDSISRATSYAEKIWHRRRTKSSIDAVSSTDMADRVAAESMAEPLPGIPHSDRAPMGSPIVAPASPPYFIPPVRSSSRNLASATFLDPPPLRQHNTLPMRLGSSSGRSSGRSSLARVVTTPPLPPPSIPPPPTPSQQKLLPVPEQPNSLPSGSNNPTRQTTRVSISSTPPSSADPSPIFDKRTLDAFPSVPQATPSPPLPGFTLGHRVSNRPSLPFLSVNHAASAPVLTSSEAQTPIPRLVLP